MEKLEGMLTIQSMDEHRHLDVRGEPMSAAERENLILLGELCLWQLLD